jgi:hypothetical protein
VTGPGVRSELTNATSGIVLAIVGVALIYVTRPVTASKKTA